MAGNRGVLYLGPYKVEVQSIDYSNLENPAGKKIVHAVILKVVSTNICGSDKGGSLSNSYRLLSFA
jgi:glutathione-independent formaldehyde dehydrogenase